LDIHWRAIDLLGTQTHCKNNISEFQSFTELQNCTSLQKQHLT
jgi:hypothetical protein